MSATSTQKIKEIIPKIGMVYTEEIPQMVLTKPKILPLKSVTLEKLEEMQKKAQEMMRQQEQEQQQQQQQQHHHHGDVGADDQDDKDSVDVEDND